MAEKVVLAYSGGLDTSVAIPWLQETYQREVVTLTADVGNERDIGAVAAKARQIGSRHFYPPFSTLRIHRRNSV